MFLLQHGKLIFYFLFPIDSCLTLFSLLLSRGAGVAFETLAFNYLRLPAGVVPGKRVAGILDSLYQQDQ